MITDDELLAACRAAGEPGTESHRQACRLYRRSVLEWRAGAARSRQGRPDLYELVALTADVAAAAGWLDDCGCGTHNGHHRHVREGTPVCPACAEAERGYAREWKRARRRAAAERAWAEAA